MENEDTFFTTRTGEASIDLGELRSFELDSDTFGYKYWDTVDTEQMNDVDLGLKVIRDLYFQLAVGERETFKNYISEKLKEII